MIINYRYYPTKAIVEIITRDCIYFSRRGFVDRGIYHKPDTISLRVVNNNARNSGLWLVIECEVYNNLEIIGEALLQNGFVREETMKKYSKQRKVEFQYNLDAVKLVGMVIANLDEASQEMPFLMYASPAQKALADYYTFLTGDIPRINYSELMQYLGYWNEDDVSGKDDEAANQDIECMVAKYKKGCWAAWASGDLIVPLFATESEARQFLIDRIRRISWHKPEVRTIPKLKRKSPPSLYVLVDHTKNVKERLAWLHYEIHRLET